MSRQIMSEVVQGLQGENDIEDVEMVEEEEEGLEGAFLVTQQLDEETQNLAAGLASRQSDELMRALQEMLKVLEYPKRGGKVLVQFVLASPKCAELLSAWELGAGAPTAVPLMLVISELLRHSCGKGELNRGAGRKGRDDAVARQKSKAVVVVQSRLDKLARAIVRSKMKDVYSHLSSSQRSRQKAALKLLSSIVLRGKLLAVEVATNFDFTLEALKKLAQHPFKVPVTNRTSGSLHQPTRFFFIEFALSFLVVGDPGLLRWILQKRPLYAGLLHGLAKDEDSTIIQVIKVFQEKVMASASLVPAGLQSAVFGDAALEQLARIAGDELFGDSADLAYETLMSLCTDPSHGLCPEYASPWELVSVKSGAHGGNQGRLLRLMLRLRVTEAFRHRQLLLAAARARPRLAAAYLDSVPYSLEPRPSPTWFSIISLVSDLISISSKPPPFSSKVWQDLPVPSPDEPLVRNSLRHLLPRALTKVALNRGLQHSNLLVRHACLRLLWEALFSLELIIKEVFAAAENTCAQVKGGSSSNASDPTRGIEDGSMNVGHRGRRKGEGTSSILNRSLSVDEVLKAEEKESRRIQWLRLGESVQDIMRATLPDPNILLIILSTIHIKEGNSVDAAGKQKRTKQILETRPAKRRKKYESTVIDEDNETHSNASNASNAGMDSEGGEADEDSSTSQTLAQVWGVEAAACAAGFSQSLLFTKVLEVLAAYQRVVPVALADKGFDPFKLLPADPIRLSLAQQVALLSLLLASTGGPEDDLQRHQSTGRHVEPGGLGSTYKHVKPLLKLMIGSRVNKIRDATHLLVSRIMISTRAFESNSWEPTLWLDHLLRLEGRVIKTDCSTCATHEEYTSQDVLGNIGESVAGFLAEAVGAVSRTLYKYFDQLFSILSAHSLGQSSEHLSGSTAPEFGPFVVCALEHTLRVVRSDSKSLSLPQRNGISLFVAGVLSDLLQIQTDARALGIIITSILSPMFRPLTADPGKNFNEFGSQWTPLQALYLQACSLFSSEFSVPDLQMQKPATKTVEFSVQLRDFITIDKRDSETAVSKSRENLVSFLICAPIHEVSTNFFQVVEVVSEIYDQNMPVLFTLCGVHCSLLMEVDFALESLAESEDLLVVRRQLVSDLLIRFSSGLGHGDMLASSVLPSPLRKQSASLYHFLKSLPFAVLFSALMHGTKGNALTFEVLSVALQNAYSSILARDRLVIMQVVLSCIQRLALVSRENSDDHMRLDICFAFLKKLVVLPENFNFGGDLEIVSRDVLLCKEMVMKSLAHPAIACFCLCSITREVNSMKHQEGVRLLDEYVFDYLKSLLESSSAVDRHEKSGSHAQLLRSLQDTTLQACRPYFEQAMTLFLLKFKEQVPGDNYSTLCKDIRRIQSFILQIAIYAEPEKFLLFIADLLSCKSAQTPVGISLSSVVLEFGQTFYESWLHSGAKTEVEDSRKGCKPENNGQLSQEILVVLFKYVVKEVLKDVTEYGDRCLLSALQTSISASKVGFHSDSNLFSLLVSITPIEIVKYCTQHPTIVRGNIARILVQASTTHRNEFGKFLFDVTRESKREEDEAPPSNIASRFLHEKELLTDNNMLRLSDNDLLLLLPAANVLLSKCHSRTMSRVVIHVASTYLRLLTVHVKRWDQFVESFVNSAQLDFELPKCLDKKMKAEELAGSFFESLVALLARCLTLCALSSKKCVSLLDKFLPNDGHPFNDLRMESFKGTEVELWMSFLKVYGKAAIGKQILSTMQAQGPENSDGNISVSKQRKQQVLVIGSIVRFADCLASTLTLVYKVNAQMQKNVTPIYIPGALTVAEALEEYLQLKLVEVVDSFDAKHFEAEIIPLFRSFAKSCLRYKFGKVEGMAVLLALVKRLLHSSNNHTYQVKEAASTVLALVLAHSQFVLYLVSCSTASNPLPLNLERQAGKGTLLSSLPSILSLLRSPVLSAVEQSFEALSDKEATRTSAFENAKVHKGNDKIAEALQGSKLVLLQLVRALFQLKMHSNDGDLSSEDKATMEELLSLLLAAYSATTDQADLEILALMHELELYGGTGFSGLASMDYLWGEAALKRRKEKVEEESRLLDEVRESHDVVLEARKRTFKEVLAVDPRRCGLSVLCFPSISQKVLPSGTPTVGTKSRMVFQSEVFDSDKHHLRLAAYDPNYILPFALHGLSEGCMDAEEFLCLGLLAVAIIALSSSQETMRKIGYKILAKYLVVSEEGPSFKGQPQIRLLLTYVKNAVTEEWQRLPFILMLFAAESSCILMHPENPHYLTITRYLLRGPAMDLEYVPLFHSMFGSGSPRYRSERLWMLRLLAYGLTSSEDSRVYRRQFVLEILMSFYSSPLADSFTRRWVLEVLKQAASIRGCAVALVGRSGFLPWLASAAVNYGELSNSQQDGDEARALPITVLEVMERILKWKNIEQRCLGEGMEEFTTAALILRHFLTDRATTPMQRAIFRRPTIRIMTYVLRLSLRKKMHQTRFSLSLHNILDTIRWVESEGPDSGYEGETTAETRALALQMLLQSSPPATLTHEDKLLLVRVASWAVPVAIQVLENLEQLQCADGIHADFNKPSERLPEKLSRWFTASLVLGKIPSIRQQELVVHSNASSLSILHGSQSVHSVHFHPANRALASRLLELLQYFAGEEGCNSLVTALAALWPFHKPEDWLQVGESAELVQKLVERLLGNISAPQEADPSWRWSFNNAWRKIQTSGTEKLPTEVEAELRQTALIVFQQIILGQRPSELVQLVSQWSGGLLKEVPTNTAHSKDLLERLESTVEELRRSHASCSR